MNRRMLGCARMLFTFAFAWAVSIPAVAVAQKPEGCRISSTPVGSCRVMLCAPLGDYHYRWISKGLPGGAATTQCITVDRTGLYFLEVFDARSGALIAKCSESVFIEKCFNSPPDCSQARAKNEMVWPPNHQMEPVVIEGVTDPDGDPVFIEVFSVTQDEPLNVEGDGSTCADAEIVNGQASVRAERTGDPNIPGNGRIYWLTFVATDGQGGKCKGSVRVCVPHDMGQGDSCIDDGQIYDSLGPCP